MPGDDSRGGLPPAGNTTSIVTREQVQAWIADAKMSGLRDARRAYARRQGWMSGQIARLDDRIDCVKEEMRGRIHDVKDGANGRIDAVNEHVNGLDQMVREHLKDPSAHKITAEVPKKDEQSSGLGTIDPLVGSIIILGLVLVVIVAASARRNA